MTIRQSPHTLNKYARAGAIALGLAFSPNSSAWAGLLDDVKVTEVPINSLAWNTDKALGVNSHGPCVTQTITFAQGSTWSLCVRAVTRFGLIISNAAYRKSPASPFITVLFDGRLGEIFVPYHPGSPRFGDISQFLNFQPLTLSQGSSKGSDCPLPRVLLDVNKICREIRDGGIDWKTGPTLVKRQQEVSYFAVLGAANYNYIMEWTFGDDGTISSRAGSTGPKLGGANDTRGHAHNFTWRLDIDLNGSGGDSACISRHFENLLVTPSTATDRCDAIRAEAGLTWNALQFNTLVITDSALRNARGRQTAYELIPLRTGTNRHTEAFTRNDFWVTRYNSGTELLAINLPSFVNGQSTVGQDNVVWYTGPVHHEDNMRDEDRQSVPVIWVGFELAPNNLFDRTPFHP